MNSNDIIRKQINAMGRIDGILYFSHMHKLNRGERRSIIDGIPKIPCNTLGRGNIAAPAIEND